MTAIKDMISETLASLKKRDADALREISHRYSEEATVTQDQKTIKIALIAYCFNKILSKVHYRDRIETLMEQSSSQLAGQDLEAVINTINDFDRKHSFFEGDLVEKAKVKVASRLYSSGLSISQSAELLNISVSDLLEYVGVTKVHNESKTMTATERLKLARQLFK